MGHEKFLAEDETVEQENLMEFSTAAAVAAADGGSWENILTHLQMSKQRGSTDGKDGEGLFFIGYSAIFSSATPFTRPRREDTLTN